MGRERDARAAPVFGQHPVHRRAVQVQDADGQDHARVRQEAAQDHRRGVPRVPLQVKTKINCLLSCDYLPLLLV